MALRRAVHLPPEADESNLHREEHVGVCREKGTQLLKVRECDRNRRILVVDVVVPVVVESVDDLEAVLPHQVRLALQVVEKALRDWFGTRWDDKDVLGQPVTLLVVVLKQRIGGPRVDVVAVRFQFPEDEPPAFGICEVGVVACVGYLGTVARGSRILVLRLKLRDVRSRIRLGFSMAYRRRKKCSHHERRNDTDSLKTMTHVSCL